MATKINNFEKFDWLLENYYIFLHATVNKTMPPTLPFEIGKPLFDFSTILHLGEDFFKFEPTIKELSSQSGCISLTAYIPKIWDQANRSSKFSKLNAFEGHNPSWIITQYQLSHTDIEESTLPQANGLFPDYACIN